MKSHLSTHRQSNSYLESKNTGILSRPITALVTIVGIAIIIGVCCFADRMQSTWGATIASVVGGSIVGVGCAILAYAIYRILCHYRDKLDQKEKQSKDAVYHALAKTKGQQLGQDRSLVRNPAFQRELTDLNLGRVCNKEFNLNDQEVDSLTDALSHTPPQDKTPFNDLLLSPDHRVSDMRKLDQQSLHNRLNQFSVTHQNIDPRMVAKLKNLRPIADVDKVTQDVINLNADFHKGKHSREELKALFERRIVDLMKVIREDIPVSLQKDLLDNIETLHKILDPKKRA